MADEALLLPTSTIIMYHPPIFKPLSSLTLSDPIQASLLRCSATGISIYSPHSMLDSVHGSINDWLTSGLGTGHIELIGDEHPSGRGGQGRLLMLDEKTTLSSLQERVKKHLGLAQHHKCSRCGPWATNGSATDGKTDINAETDSGISKSDYEVGSIGQSHHNPGRSMLFLPSDTLFWLLYALSVYILYTCIWVQFINVTFLSRRWCYRHVQVWSQLSRMVVGGSFNFPTSQRDVKMPFFFFFFFFFNKVY